MNKLPKWVLALTIMLLLSFASAGVSCAMMLCTAVSAGAISSDPLRVALVLLQGRLVDLDAKFGDAFRELRTMMRKI